MPIHTASGDWGAEAARLRASGYALPNNPALARVEAKKVAATASSGSLTDLTNRQMTAEMRRSRLSATRGATGFTTRTASDMMMALPKVRMPGASLLDKGIPINVHDPKELVEIRRWSRLFYSTHDLIPLLIDIYSRFPLVGLEFASKDAMIEKFYTSMFLDDLHYEEFLPECIGREFFLAGECTTLAHFDEQLGIWSSEEVLNPDMLAVSKGLFIQQERVQLLVKDMVESLRNGPEGRIDTDERPSERLERNYEYCCIPTTRVLTESLDWIPIGELKLGDKLIAFDEYPLPGRAQMRKWRSSEITATSVIQAPTFEVKTTGPSVICTGEHRWLVHPIADCSRKDVTMDLDTSQDEYFYPEWLTIKRDHWIRRPCHNPDCDVVMELRPSQRDNKFHSRQCYAAVKFKNSRKFVPGLQWVKTEDLRPGDKIRAMATWEHDDSCDGGYVSGIYDGEGSLNVSEHTQQLNFSQKAGPVLDKTVSILERHKFALTNFVERNGVVEPRIMGGIEEVMRCLGTFKPIRLVPKIKDAFYGRNIGSKTGVWVEVTSVEPRGIQNVVALATSTKTLIAEGMFSHNTQLVRNYPEIIQAAARDDGLDISDALVSRLVNKANPWDLRGTPFLLRSFRTLMMEESLNAAQDAVCVPAGTPVLTVTGVKYIEDITTDDQVLTHRGRYRQVVRPMVREADEPGVTIRWWYDQPLTLTGEHPVYIRRKVVQHGVCAVCRASLRTKGRGLSTATLCSDHQPFFRMRGICQHCGQEAVISGKKGSMYCAEHLPENQKWVEGFIKASDVGIYDQVLHPSSPTLTKEYVSIWEHLDQSDWVVYDPTDSAFGMTGHFWYDGAADQTQRVACKRVETVLSECEAQSGDILRHNRFGAKTQHFAAEYKLTDDLLWLIGLHVADGSATINNSTGAPHGSVVITLGLYETDLQERAIRVIREIFGIDSLATPCWGGKKAVKVTANSLPLAMWFREMCGVDNTKRFPSWSFGLTPQQSAAIIQGWMDGDGCVDACNDDREIGSSAYRHLQESASWLMRRAGIVTSSRLTKPQGGYSGSGVQYVATTVKTPKRAYPADQGGYWVEVRSVEHHQVIQTVYNLEVEEDHSYCAPIALHNCDRLYSPMVLATMGIENMGNDEPWIPSQAELDNLRDDMQTALAADFKLLVHNMGVQVTSVFGRESVPNFDSDYDRIDAKLMQAWGVGQALIMGGTGAGGTYASSALNREVCELLMKGFQKKVMRHMRKRMEVIAEAQEHFDYELKGGVRVPLYREIREEDPETGEVRIVRAPKLLIPEVKFASLNLRDESVERSFISQLKQMGVPVSDKALAVNIQVDFEQELEREAEETVKKGIAKAQAFKKMQDLCDAQNLPYPPELAQHLEATLQLRQMLAQTDELEDQAKQMDIQTKQMMSAGQQGVLPGTPPPQGEDDGSQEGDPSMGSDPAQGAMGSSPPMASGPSGAPMGDPSQMGEDGGQPEPSLNRSRPVESDEMRGNAPRAAAKTAAQRWAERVHPDPERKPTWFELGPSSTGHAHRVSEEQVQAAVRRREMYARHSTTPLLSKLVKDPDFYRMLNMQGYHNQIQSDWPEIRNGGAKESADLLREMVEQYEDATGVSPQWD